jgi:hypothetical protein
MANPWLKERKRHFLCPLPFFYGSEAWACGPPRHHENAPSFRQTLFEDGYFHSRGEAEGFCLFSEYCLTLVNSDFQKPTPNPLPGQGEGIQITAIYV